MSIKRLEPASRYSHVVIHNETVYLSGVIAADFSLDMHGQCEQVFQEVDRQLALAGTSKSRLLSLQCFIQSFEDFDQFNSAYDKWIDTENLPTRATVQASAYDDNIRIEIVAIAAV